MPKELVGAEKALVFNLWRGDRAAECTGLENRRSESYRGFESHPLRHCLESTMPIYNYSCKNCSAEFEKILSVSERDLPLTCPECDSAEVFRVVSKSTFSLKGNGWYKDGYQNMKTKE